MLRILVAALFCLLTALVAVPARAETVHSLSQVPGAIKTPEGKSTFAQQMAGVPAPDALGLKLSAGLTAAQIAGLILPKGDKAPLSGVGAKPLPGEADRYIAIVCTGGDVPTRPDDTRCYQYGSDDPKPPLQAWLGLIEAKPGAAPRLVAKPIAVDGKADWDESGLPTQPEAADKPAESFDGFDLAPYRIAPDERAYGLRGTWAEGYSGGMASYGALYLFAVVDGALKQVLAVPMSSYQDSAGDWNKDGTRDHDIQEGANVLLVTAQRSDGHFDLRVKSRKGKFQRLYRWSAAAQAYRPAVVKGGAVKGVAAK